MKFNVNTPEVAQARSGIYKLLVGTYDFAVENIEIFTRERKNPKEGQTPHYVAMKFTFKGLTGDAQGVTLSQYFSFVANSDEKGNLVESVDKNGTQYTIHPNSNVYALLRSMGVFSEAGSVNFEPKNYVGTVVAIKVVPAAYIKNGNKNFDTAGIAALIEAQWQAEDPIAEFSKEDLIELTNGEDGVNKLRELVNNFNEANGFTGDDVLKLKSEGLFFYLPFIDREKKPYGYEENDSGEVFRVWTTPQKLVDSRMRRGGGLPTPSTTTPTGDSW